MFTVLTPTSMAWTLSKLFCSYLNNHIFCLKYCPITINLTTILYAK